MLFHHSVETRSAGYHLERFLKKTENDGYKKESNYKLATFYLINNNKQKFNLYRETACEVGDDVQERDREAMYDCALDYMPDINLTKARLLIEGGNFDWGNEYLKLYKLEDDSFLPYKLQYLFLRGIVQEHHSDYRKAIRTYKEVITFGEDEYYQFASEAALVLELSPN